MSLHGQPHHRRELRLPDRTWVGARVFPYDEWTTVLENVLPAELTANAFWCVLSNSHAVLHATNVTCQTLQSDIHLLSKQSRRPRRPPGRFLLAAQVILGSHRIRSTQIRDGRIQLPSTISHSARAAVPAAPGLSTSIAPEAAQWDAAHTNG